MRKDFNKLLVENPRVGSGRKFGNTRNTKRLQSDDEIGGKKGMHRRHSIEGNPRSFNENLSPLVRWLTSKVGKNWDKSYSELRKTFDARSTVNAHIFQHLFEFVNINTKVVDGKVMILESNYNGRGYVPVSEVNTFISPCSYYVCPKSGTLKVLFHRAYKAAQRERRKKSEAEVAKVFRVVNDRQHLYLIEGVWFICEISDVPKPVVFVDTLGIKRTRVIPVVDVLTGPVDAVMDTRRYHVKYKDKQHMFLPRGKYYSLKRTASHKFLKIHGLI